MAITCATAIFPTDVQFLKVVLTLLPADTNSNPKLAVHVRTLYTNISALPWPIEGGQDIALTGDLVRHLRGLRAQVMRQILSLIKKAVRNLTRVEDLIIKSHNPKITNALLGILGWSPKLAKLDIIEADLKTCQLSRGRGKVPAYEVLKKIVQDSSDPEDVKAEQMKVINRSHTENGWMHCLPTAWEVKEPPNGLCDIPPVSSVEGTGDHEDRAPSNLPPIHSDEGQSSNSLIAITTQTQVSEGACSGSGIQSRRDTSHKKSGKEKQNTEISPIALTLPELRQRFSKESMNRALWNPVEITAYDPRSDQGSSTRSEAEPYYQFNKERSHKPPPCKHHNGSYFYPALTHLTLQSCIYGPPSHGPTPGRPPITPRKSIRATVALRRFLTRCPNLQELSVRDCTIQPEALFDFGSPRRAVWWRSIYGQTLMDAAVGPLFVTEMQCVVEVPFEEDLYSSGDSGGQPQQTLASPSLPHQSGEGGGGSAPESSNDAAAQRHAEALQAKMVDDPKRLMEKVWQSLRDNNNHLLTFPNLEVLNIDNCSIFIRPEVPYRWISSPGFNDFFLRHHKLNRLTWDGYILHRHLRLDNPIFLKTAHHLGQTLRVLLLNHLDCGKGSPSVPHQIPPAAAHQNAFSFSRLNAFLRCLKALETIDLFVDLIPTSQIIGVARTLRDNNITQFNMGRAKGVMSAADVDALVECLPKVEIINIMRWRPKDYVHGFPEVRNDPPGYGDLIYEEDENFPTQDEGADQRLSWFSVAELATKISHLPNLASLSLNYTFPLPEEPPLAMSPNEIFKTLCDENYHTQDELIAVSTTPGTPQSIWIKEYLNALRTTAEIFASTAELTKLTNITLGYFVHDCRSRSSVSIARDEVGKPLKYECYQLPEYVCAVMVAHDIEVVGGSLRPDGEKSADERLLDGKTVNEEVVGGQAATEKAANGVAKRGRAVEDKVLGGSVVKEEADGKLVDETTTAQE
ncbi:MAG: hypothetical protein M1840_000427 [Geoglossum simile]|nr:MAG: hypothetical protein M1840_000427 [Geoglossum simile]